MPTPIFHNELVESVKDQIDWNEHYDILFGHIGFRTPTCQELDNTYRYLIIKGSAMHELSAQCGYKKHPPLLRYLAEARSKSEIIYEENFARYLAQAYID